MAIVLLVFVAAAILELGLGFVKILWQLRRAVVAVVVVGIAFSCGALFFWRANVASGMILTIGAYRVFNLLRVVGGRMEGRGLRQSARLASLWLVLFQIIIADAWLAHLDFHPGGTFWLACLVLVQLLSAIILLLSTWRTIVKTRPLHVKKAYADNELPTLSVAIPARDEDEQLESCLNSVLASDYPKLEVLVLDDCSRDRTAEIIRQFAHDGVRFIPGEEPKSSWLAKNQAYEKLAAEASGDILLFCGVDVRFGPKAARDLVTNLLAKHKTMISVLPVNDLPGLPIIQSLRYFWELAPPRRQFNRPPVLSTCWLITHDELKHSGGFKSVSNSVTPEAHFAREAIKHDGYSFVRSDAKLQITSIKSRSAQLDTAIRTRYPQLHRRPELVFVVVLAEFAFLFLPFVMFLVGLSGVFGLTAALALSICCLLLSTVYCSITFNAFPRGRFQALAMFPVAVLVDVVLLNYSMWKYEFSEVDWKGRNVCLPVMRRTTL